MRRLALCALIVIAGCAKGADQAGQDTTTTVAAAPAFSLDSVMGTWQVRGSNEAGDSVIGYRLTAMAGDSGWQMTFPGRAPVPVRVVSVSGDSIVTEAGPYESALRRGVMVSTRGAFRLVNGQLIGRTVARYDVRTADSVLVINSVGTKVQ